MENTILKIYNKPGGIAKVGMVVGYYYGVYYHGLVLQLQYFTIIMHKPQPSILRSKVSKTCQVSSIGSCQCEIETYNHMKLRIISMALDCNM